jgi:hypothetical protein
VSIPIHVTTSGEKNLVNQRPSLAIIATTDKDHRQAAGPFYEGAVKYFDAWAKRTGSTLVKPGTNQKALYLQGIFDLVNDEYKRKPKDQRVPFLVINIVAHGNEDSWFVRTAQSETAKTYGAIPSPPSVQTAAPGASPSSPDFATDTATLAGMQTASTQAASAPFHLIAERTAAGSTPAALPGLGAVDGWTEVRLWSCHIGARSRLPNGIAQLFVPRTLPDPNATTPAAKLGHQPADFAPCVCAPRATVVFGTTDPQPPSPSPPNWVASAPFYSVLGSARFIAKSRGQWDVDPMNAGKLVPSAARSSLKDSLIAQRKTSATHVVTLSADELSIIATLEPYGAAITSAEQKEVSAVDLPFDDGRVIAAAQRAATNAGTPKPELTGSSIPAKRAAVCSILNDAKLAAFVADDLWKDASIRNLVWEDLAAGLLDGVASPEYFLSSGGWWSGTGRPKDPTSLEVTVIPTPDAQTSADVKIVRLFTRITYEGTYFETPYDPAKRVAEKVPFYMAAITDKQFFHRVTDMTPDHVPGVV